MSKKIMLAVLSALLVVISFGQNKSLSVGAKIITDYNFETENFSPGFGGQIVYRMTKHSGIESGLYYNNQRMTFYYYSNIVTGSIDIAERWLTLPVLYRFDSRIINFVVGPQLEYFLGWKEKSNNSQVQINSYSRDALKLGAALGLSKTIHLSKNWVLEPETKLNFYPNEEYGTLNLNFALRKTLF